MILFYHRFKDRDETSLTHKLNIRSFERQILHLKRWYNVLTLDELCEHINNKEDFLYPSIVITIDDGFKDNYDLAYPIIKRYELPATIFLTSGLINTQKAPWVDEIGVALRNSRLDRLHFPQLFGAQVVDISSDKRKAKILSTIYEKLLYLEHRSKLDLIDNLLDTLSDKGDLYAQNRTMLNWEEIEEMSRHNISFGAHTITHPTLSKMPFEEAVHEIRASKRDIEDHLGICIKHFAIPNGKQEDFSKELTDLFRNGEFESICTTLYGSVGKKTDRYILPRVCIDGRLFIFAVGLARAFIQRGETT